MCEKRRYQGKGERRGERGGRGSERGVEGMKERGSEGARKGVALSATTLRRVRLPGKDGDVRAGKENEGRGEDVRYVGAR